MSELYPLLKTIHVLSAAILFGTGLGTAFHMWRADRTGDVAIIAAAARQAVLADWLFTAPAVVVQPLSGVALMHTLGLPLTEGWVLASILLYALAGACWLPVVWLQIRMRDLAADAQHRGAPLPARHNRYMRIWFALGWPAFAAVVAIFFLMVFRPEL